MHKNRARDCETKATNVSASSVTSPPNISNVTSHDVIGNGVMGLTSGGSVPQLHYELRPDRPSSSSVTKGQSAPSLRHADLSEPLLTSSQPVTSPAPFHPSVEPESLLTSPQSLTPQSSVGDCGSVDSVTSTRRTSSSKRKHPKVTVGVGHVMAAAI